MSLYFTGDIHGQPMNNLSFSKASDLREVTEEDTMIILGDCGLPFGIEMPTYEIDYKKTDLYNISWLNSQKYQTIFICGNHDDRSAISKMPIVEKYGGQVRQMEFDSVQYPNIVYIDKPGIYTIEDKTCLIIPGAQSHDVWGGILDPDDPEFMEKLKEASRKQEPFRIKNWTWWEDEDIDIELCRKLSKEQKWETRDFDFILTHDCPALYNKIFTSSYGIGRLKSTEGEEYLEELRNTLSFDTWLHGHMHVNKLYPPASKEINSLGQTYTCPGDNRVFCLYDEILKVL